MVKRYNLSNLQASFRNYLLAEIKSPFTIKNYLSDFRHFTAWLLFIIDSSALQTNQENLVDFINDQTIKDYKEYLVRNRIPLKTINRRLSTLRKFCTFCIKQGWMSENLAKKVTNISKKPKNKIIFDEYRLSLQHESLADSEIKNYLKIAQEILQI